MAAFVEAPNGSAPVVAAAASGVADAKAAAAAPAPAKPEVLKTPLELLDMFTNTTCIFGATFEEVEVITAGMPRLALSLAGHARCCICHTTDVKDLHTAAKVGESDSVKSRAKKQPRRGPSNARIPWSPKICMNGHIYWPGGSTDLSKNRLALEETCKAGKCTCYENFQEVWRAYYGYQIDLLFKAALNKGLADLEKAIDKMSAVKDRIEYEVRNADIDISDMDT